MPKSLAVRLTGLILVSSLFQSCSADRAAEAKKRECEYIKAAMKSNDRNSSSLASNKTNNSLQGASDLMKMSQISERNQQLRDKYMERCQ